MRPVAAQRPLPMVFEKKAFKAARELEISLQELENVFPLRARWDGERAKASFGHPSRPA